MVGRIHIIVAEPSAIIRCGLVTLLQRASVPNITVVEMSDVSAASSQKYSQTPDLLIVNPSLLGMFSPSQLRSDIGNATLKIVALQSAFADQSTLQNYDDVISIYDSVDSIKDKVLSLTRSGGDQGLKRELSQREKEIIVCVVKGMTNKQIADELILSTHTIIAHRRNIASKLQINSPSGLTIYAIVNKLVDLSDIKNSIMQSSEEE